ncbi:MAG: SO_0444 family Cu/Zn efflux transporter [Spirochaetota bacterium]|nr:SO_0444 family Cu/Zn efflux transporter [Spirochaetota bacterium]
MEYLLGVLSECYGITVDAGIYIFVGFVIAGLIKSFMRTDKVRQSLGTNSFKSVFKASLYGIPLPLCSCSVIPVALSLKKQGASNGSVTAFMISTPETGVDSVAITYSLLDPIFTVFRPVAAFFTALAAGISQNLFGHKNGYKEKPELSNCCENGKCLDTDPNLGSHANASNQLNLWQKVKYGMRYAFTDLLPDIQRSLFLGILLTGLIAYFIPYNLLSTSYDYPFLSMLAMLVISIPIYTCASSSTPVASSLILSGVYPGAVLVFLLAGPATNMLTMSTVLKAMGGRGLFIYLLSIIVISLLAGFLLDFVYGFFSLIPKETVYSTVSGEDTWIKHVFGILLSSYLVLGNIYWIIKKLISKSDR